MRVEIIQHGMNMSSPISSDKELARKAFMKKVKRGVVVAVVIVIVAVVVFVLISPGELSIKFTWHDNHPQYGSPPFVHFEGTIFNSGTKNATDVKLIVRLYDSYNTLIKTETVDVGDVLANGSKDINVDIPHLGLAERCETELQWKPYG